ncbi:hypothetical protein EB061_02965 [bacterium]|nr:hypothetical protein [bacterium]
MIFLAAFAMAAGAHAGPKNGKQGGDKQKEGNFSERKAAIMKRVAEEKAALDQFSNCVSSASVRDDLKKCRESREASMKSIRKAQREELKKHLRGQLEKLEGGDGND